MTKPRFGIWVPVYGPWGARHHPDEPSQPSYSRSLEIVRQAEALDFEVALLAQHMINPMNNEFDQLETWSASAALAQATHRIEIMGAVKPFFFHPAVLAKMALGIDAISNGRFSINLISGWYLTEMEQAGLEIRAHQDRYRFSREWIQIVKALWNRESVTFDGEWFHLKELRLLPGPIAKPRPPVYLGGESEPARALAADEADVFLINGRPVELIREIVADLVRRPRRQPDPLRFGMAAFVIARPTKREAQDEFDHLSRLAQPDDYRKLMTGVDPDVAMFKTFATAPRGVGTNGGTSARLVDDYDTVARRVLDFIDAGIETFLLQFQPFEREMRVFADQIMPRVADLRRTGTAANSTVTLEAPTSAA